MTPRDMLFKLGAKGLARAAIVISPFLAGPIVGLAETAAPLSLAELQQQAQKERNKAHWDKVIALLKSHTDGISTPSLVILAEAYEAKKQHREAVQVLKQILNQSENNFRIWL